MASYFAYPCPDCRSTNDLHEPECRFAGTPWTDVEKAYVDVIAPLSAGARAIEDLQAVVDDWDALHAAAVEQLRSSRRVRETDDGALELLTPGEYREAVSKPTFEPLQTIYEYGSVPGSHDNAAFALIAYYEMVGLSWPETKQNVLEWLRESGAWERGGFEESSPEELVENKRHVYEEGYGWKEKARAAKAVIDRARAR